MKSKSQQKTSQRTRRHRRIRAKVVGTASRPRLSVFKSNQHVYAQIIDDEKSVTLVAASSEKAKGKNVTERAEATGKEIAKRAKEKKISKVVFDRGGFIYTGKIEALARGAREGGLEF